MIRKAKKEDLNKIADLWEQMSSMHDSLDDSFRMKKGAKEKFKSYAETVIQDSTKLSIVYDDNGILGYLFAEITEQPPVYNEEQIGIISEVSVDSVNRRSGIGLKLLQYSENWFKEKGIRRIDCQVATKNPISRNFWTKNGFVEHSKICSKLI